MKMFIISLSFMAAASQLGAASARADLSVNEMVAIATADLHAQQGFNLIEWKIGDELDYNIKMMGMNLGTMVKKVTSEEGNAIWVTQDMKLMGQSQKIETLISRADGKILKMKQNGQDAQVPDDKVEIIDQEYTEVTVPAGKFDALHVTAKSTQVKKMEVWINPTATCQEGSLKIIADTQMGQMTLELTKFNKI